MIRQRTETSARTGIHVLSALLLFALFAAVTGWIYWPGISGPELLDDRSSVLVMDDLNHHPELAFDYVFGDKSGVLGRSVSMAR